MKVHQLLTPSLCSAIALIEAITTYVHDVSVSPLCWCWLLLTACVMHMRLRQSFVRVENGYDSCVFWAYDLQTVLRNHNLQTQSWFSWNLFWYLASAEKYRFNLMCNIWCRDGNRIKSGLNVYWCSRCTANTVMINNVQFLIILSNQLSLCKRHSPEINLTGSTWSGDLKSLLILHVYM